MNGITSAPVMDLPKRREVSLTDIHVPERRVREHRHDPTPLAESMREVGQLTPITLNRDLTLVAGLHRLEAAKLLGWKTIRAEVNDFDEIGARLAEIDENLCRHDLTVWELSRHVAEREKLLVERGERAKVGENQHMIGTDTVSVPRSTSNLAEELGVSEKTYRRRHKIGREIGAQTAAVLDQADITDEKTRNFLNSTTQLNHLADISNKRGDEVAAEVAERALTEEVGNTFKIYEEMKREQSKAEREIKREEHRATLREAPPHERRYEVVYADPPWRYDHSETDSSRVENQYPTMSLEEIRALEVPSEEDSVLFVWATSPKLTEALEVMAAWGFCYRTCMVWVKNRIGMGYYARQQHELVLIGKKGNPPVPEPSSRPSSVFYADRTVALLEACVLLRGNSENVSEPGQGRTFRQRHPSRLRFLGERDRGGGLVREVHDFHQSLSKSQALEDSPLWTVMYTKLFPDLEYSKPIRQNGWAQQGGTARGHRPHPDA